MHENPRNFAVVGVGGYVAPRHLRAIREVGGRLIAAADPNDSVGILDQFSFDVRFFTEMERLDRHLEKLRRGPVGERVHYLSICSPNYLHDAHCRLGLRLGADVICEKPLVINPWNLDVLEGLEQETGRRVFTILQLRLHPMLAELRETLFAEKNGMHEVDLTYVTPRGPWYDGSWKASTEKSGGVPMNVGIHLFDLVLWLFGPVQGLVVHIAEPRRCGGVLQLLRARVRWFLSTEPADIERAKPSGTIASFRSIRVDGAEVEFSQGFSDLHSRVYEKILSGHGLGIADARPSIELVHRIRTAVASDDIEDAHPIVRKLRSEGEG
jgi:UDP-N-acetyl-2-amino-2-deoxyglucuronate dehydrogenase